MKNRTRWIGLGLAAVCACWATSASALVTWWGPMDADQLPPVGENVLGTSTPDISATKMAEIENAVNNASPAPVGEGPGTNMVLHVWPVGAVGPNRIIYVPVSGPGPGRIAVTKTTTIAPVGERIVTVRRIEPVGERIVTVRRIEPVGERVVTTTRLAPVGERVVMTTGLAPVGERIVTTRRIAPVGERIITTRRVYRHHHVVRVTRTYSNY